jgi:hypothetical protein
MKKHNYYCFSLLTLIFIFLSCGLYAQSGILKGHITEKGSNKAVSYVTIYLLKDGKIVDQTVSDEYGNYTFKKLLPAFFDLKVIVSGYNVGTIQNIEIKNEKITLLDLCVEEKTDKPKEPAFKPLLPLISREQTPAGMSFNEDEIVKMGF